jgi:hypothetical protein
VHREEAVKDLRTQNMIVGIGELNADHQSLGPSDKQEEGRVQNVKNPKAFMVDRHYPSVKFL